MLFWKFDASVIKINDVDLTWRDHTERPVPVRLSASISAFPLKNGFEIFDICTMPGEELSSAVDLCLRWITVWRVGESSRDSQRD